MPTPTYGPQAGQTIPESAVQAYVQANGIGQFTRTPEEQTALDNDLVRQTDPNAVDQSVEEHEAEQARIRAANEAAYAANGGRGVQQGATAAAQGRAQSGMQPNAWDSYFQNGLTNPSNANTAFNTTNADAARTWQQQIMQDLQRQAAGDPNSRAQQGLAAGYGQARAGQSALGSSLRGTGGAAGLRAGVMGAGNVQRGFAGDSQMLMTQERQGAQALLAQQLQQQRGQDAGQAQAMSQNTLGNQGLANAMSQFYTQGAIGRGLSNYQYGADFGRASLGFDLDAQNLAAQQRGEIAQGAGTALSAATHAWGSKPEHDEEENDHA